MLTVGRTAERGPYIPDEMQRIVMLESDADRADADRNEIRLAMKELTAAVDARLGKIQASLIAILMVLIAALIGFALNLIGG